VGYEDVLTGVRQKEAIQLVETKMHLANTEN